MWRQGVENDGKLQQDVTAGKPTIDDVASLAGVARTTVSRVLNNKPNVRPEVREKVLRAVEMLDYRVNPQARNLAGRTSHRIILVHASDFDFEPNSYYSAAIELGATRAAAQLGQQLATHIVNQNDPLAAATILGLVRDDQGDGLILTPPFSDDLALIKAVQERGCNVMCIAGGPQITSVAPTLAIDEQKAGYDIGRHLLEVGHRRFGFIHGLKQHLSAAMRFNGFVAALQEAKLGSGAISERQGSFTFRSGIECAQSILSDQVPPTAIVCANDDMAAGALLAAHKAGLRIPQDIAITGFDDTPVSEIVWPPLTTIHQPLRRIGARAVELLVEVAAAEEKPAPHPEIIGHHLVVRDSTSAR